MQTADFNHNDFAVGQEAEADKNLLVRFFLKEREDKTKTAEEGRPMFKEVEYVEIRIPGKRDVQACRPATFHDKQRFPRHYDMFKQRIEMPTEGTPLSEWPQISRSMVEELSFMQIKTVEQLVAASDQAMSQMRGGLSLKQKAVDFLKYADQTKLINEKEALQARLAEQDELLAAQGDQIAEMQKALAELTMAKSAAPAPIKRRGRKTEAPPEIEA